MAIRSALRCAGNVPRRTVSCEPPTIAAKTATSHSSTPGADRTGTRDLSVGVAHGPYFGVVLKRFAYNAATDVFSMNEQTINNLGQAMGTPDGILVTGVETFLCAGPTVASGTGKAVVANADGTDSITAPNQPYFLAHQILGPSDSTAARTWAIQLSPGVSEFTFDICVFTAFPAEYTTPSQAPDSEPVSASAPGNVVANDSNYAGPHAFNSLVLAFVDSASADGRALAVAKVGGLVIGGWSYEDMEGSYLVRVPGDSTGRGLEAAIQALTALPQVELAIPYFVAGPQTEIADATGEQRPMAGARALSQPQADGSDMWDTTAWARAHGARLVVVEPFSDDSLAVAFVTEVPGILGPIRTVIRDEASWDSLWGRMNSHGHWGGGCCRTPPAVDFHRAMLLVAGNGYRFDGSDIAIVRALEKRDTLYALVLSSTDMPPDCHLDSGRNTVAIARVPRTMARVVFLEGHRRGSCGRDTG